MFDWIGNQFDNLLSTYVLDVVSTLVAALAPLALIAMTIWILLYGWAVARNEVSEPVPVFVWNMFKIGLVIAISSQAAFYIASVSDAANGLAMGVASAFLPDGVDPAAVTTPYALLDKFNDEASAQVSDIMKEASMFRLDLVLAAVIFSFGSVIFLCMALFVVTLSKLLLTFVIAVGPLFVLCLAWRPTQRFFDSWLSMVLNAVVLTWFAFFALGLSAFMGDAIFRAIEDGGGFLGPHFNVLAEATRYCIVMILMAIICFQAPTLAAALTGGPVVQQGVQMIQNAMMVSGLRARNRGAAGGAGGVIRGGTGLPYATGHAAGSAVAAAGAAARRTAGSGGAAGTVGTGRLSANKLAAHRGWSKPN